MRAVDRISGRTDAGAPSVWGLGFSLIGLVGLAITQPILDLMGRNPEFFVAGRYTSSQIVEFALVVAVVPSLVVFAVFGVARLAHPRLGGAVHALIVALLGALFGNVLARGLGADGGRWALVAAVGGAAVASAAARLRAGRMLLQYLAAANLLFLGGFLFASPSSELLSSDVDADALGEVSIPELPGPVMVVVFDELPISTLMQSDGTINEERYPAFARLEAGSTWYRNASSVHNRTERALPAITTGNVLNDRLMPTFEEFPRNLLSLFSTSVPVERYEAITDMCPPETCKAREGQSIRQALEDSLVVYGHRVLPARLRDDLPPIDDAWGSFGEAVDGPAVVELEEDPSPSSASSSPGPLARWQSFTGVERAPETQAARLVEQALAVDADPALHFVHIVLPHAPWLASPWDTRLMLPMPEWVLDPAQPGYDWSALIRYQRHSLQTGLADAALGQLIDHLEAEGLWADTTVVVMADHGTSTLNPDVGREVTDANVDEVLRVPLFVKEPGQAEPRVVDDVALVTDVLPTLVDLLDIETDWTFEGHSLLDGSDVTVEPLVSRDVDALMEIVRRHEADFPYGWDWSALAAVGPQADSLGRLVGTPLSELSVGTPSDLSWTARNEVAFASLPNESREVPQLVTGTVTGPGPAPPNLLLVVNGTVAGVTGGYQPGDGGWTFSSVLGPYLRDGANEIAAYEVTGAPGAAELHLLE
jgi:hypothetical protein